MIKFSRRRVVCVAAASAVALGAAACGSSSSAAGGSPSGGASKESITVGLVTDLTGATSSGNRSSVAGVKAGTYYAARNGMTIKYVVGDTASTPATALTVTQKLITQDHVSALISTSSMFFAAAAYATAHNIPVVGISQDGPEWITSKNMFSVSGPLQETKVSTTLGKFFKLVGATNLATLGYGVSPISSEAAESTAKSAEAAGLRVGYLNAKFPIGSTDVGPTVLQMKGAGIDALSPSTDPDTGFGLIKGLRDAGVNLKAALLATGYGGDLLQAGAGALSDAQNVYFLLGYEPVEMQTVATKQFVADLESAGTTSEPTVEMYNGYTSVGLLVRALKAAGPSPSSATITKALAAIHDWDGMGLYGGHTVDINDRVNVVSGADNCEWMTKLEGSTFTLVPGADPICGDEVQGVTVAPAS